MGDRTTRIVIKAEDQASAALAKVGKGVGDLADSAGNVGTSWADMATPIQSTIAIFKEVGAAAQQAYEYVGEGTQMALTQERFGALAGSIGTTADVLMGQLRTATRGTVADFQLMDSASTLLNLGLATTQEETVRLSSLAGKLNWDMSVLALTIANQSTARLDSLGLSMGDVTTRADALAAQGMATDQAFKFAIIEAGEAKLELLGDVADTAAGKLQILETNATNFSDSFKIAFGAELVTGLNDFSNGLFETQERSASTGTALAGMAVEAILVGLHMKTAADSVEEMKDAVMGQTGQIVGASVASTTYKGAIEAEYAAMMESLTAIDDRSEAITSHNQVLIDSNALLAAEAAILYQETSPAYAEFQDKLMQTGAQSSATEQSIRAANLANQQAAEDAQQAAIAYELEAQAIANHNTLLGDYFVVASNATGQGESLETQLYDLIAAGDGSATSIAAAGLALGQFTEDEAEAYLQGAILRDRMDEIKERFQAGEISASQLRGEINKAVAEVQSMSINVNDATGTVAIFSGEMGTATQSTANLITKFGEVPYEVETNFIMNDDEAISSVDDYKYYLAGIPEEVTTTIVTNYVNTGSTSPGTANASGGNQGAPGNAAGTDFWRGGWTMVGEEGPELVNLPRGSAIYPNDETNRMIRTGPLRPVETGGGQPIIQIGQINIYDRTAAEMLLAYLEGNINERALTGF